MTFWEARLPDNQFLAVRRIYESNSGTIEKFFIPRAHTNGDPKHFIYIKFAHASSARKAYDKHIVMVGGVRTYVGPADETDDKLQALTHQ